jgi:type IV pilus assembly protein PilC
MAVFIWEGRTRQGSIKKGTMEAPDSEAVMAQLRAQMIVPINVKAKAKDVMEYLPFLKKGIKTKSLVIFTRQFAVMIDAGLPLVQCLDLLAEQEPNQTFQEVLRAVKADVEQGATFAESRPVRSGVFSTRS